MLTYNGVEVTAGTLESNNIIEGSVLTLTSSSGVVRKREICISDLSGTLKPEEYLDYAKKHPHLIEQYRSNTPKFADALASGDVGEVRKYLMLMHMGTHKKIYSEKQELARIDQDPTNEENQKKIAEMIRLKNIQENYETALEDTPEVFGRVVMLYVDTNVNNVDSGAQSTSMTLKCVERVGLQHLIDTRFKGVAKGVGSCKILGRIHIAQMELGDTFYPVSITVLEGGDVDFLLGLDMLKRHHAVMNMGENSIQFDGGKPVHFLSENQMPLHARGNYEGEVTTTTTTTSSSSSTTTGTTSSSSMTPEQLREVEKRAEAVGAAAVARAKADSERAKVAVARAKADSERASSNSNTLPPVPPTTTQTTPAPTPIDNEKVQQLMQLGFGEVEATAALTQASGNMELAASLLLSR